jgi:Rrf2 family transcriptional regulator, cysteine metabolism repressor
MKLSRKSEYACLAMIDLAHQVGKGNVRAGDIASRNKIPPKYLEQILLILKRAGFIRSVRGANGGYRLARDAAAIRMADILRLMDGALAPVSSVSEHFYEKTPIEKVKKLHGLLKEIRDSVVRKLERTTLADIA